MGYYGGDRWGQEVEIFCSYRTHMTHYERIFGRIEGQGSKHMKNEVRPFKADAAIACDCGGR